MSTTFLEPGGDSTFIADSLSAGGFWLSKQGTPAIVTDFVHGSHIKSIQYRPGNQDRLRTPAGVAANAGTRVSFYVYLAALGSSEISIFNICGASNEDQLDFYIDTGGVLRLKDAAGTQIGGDGATLATGTWYRLCLAYTITSTTVNEFRVYVNGALSITATNSTININGVATSGFRVGNLFNNASLDFRSSDHYADNSNALSDPGDIWVTAKRPNANGTTNGFSTQVGAGGSGYGTGHSPQVNERALSTTNGWSMIGAGSAVTEEYNIEAKATGDIDISSATIIDYLGWVSAKSLAGETASIIVNNTTTNISLTSSNTIFTKIAGSSTYPAGTGTDIGIVTDTSLTTVTLNECGVMVAYKVGGAVAAARISNLTLLGVG